MRIGRQHQNLVGHEVSKSLDVHGDSREREIFTLHSRIRDSSWNGEQKKQNALSQSLNEGSQLGNIIKIAQKPPQGSKSIYSQPPPWFPQKRVNSKKSNKDSKNDVSQALNEEIKQYNYGKLRGDIDVKSSPKKGRGIGGEQGRFSFKSSEKQNQNSYSAYHSIITNQEEQKEPINNQYRPPSSSSKQNNHIVGLSYEAIKQQGSNNQIAGNQYSSKQENVINNYQLGIPQYQNKQESGSINHQQGIAILNNYLNQTINIDKDSKKQVVSKQGDQSRIQSGSSHFYQSQVREDQLRNIYGQKPTSQSSQGVYSQGTLQIQPFFSSKSYSVNANRPIWKEENIGGMKSASGQRRIVKQNNNNPQENYYNIGFINSLDISLPQDKNNTTKKLKKSERLKSGGWRGQNSRSSNMEITPQNFLSINSQNKEQPSEQVSNNNNNNNNNNNANANNSNSLNSKLNAPQNNNNQKNNNKIQKNIAPSDKGRSSTIDVDKLDGNSKSGGRYSQLDKKIQNKVTSSLERNSDSNNKDSLNRSKLNNLVSNMMKQANLNLIAGSKENSNPTSLMTNLNTKSTEKQDIDKLKQIEKKQIPLKGNQGVQNIQLDQKDKKQVQMKIAERTKKGVLASNPQKVNQDSVLVVENLGQNKDQHLFGVFDGHGALGHKVSQFIKQQLSSRLLGDQRLLRTNPKAALFNAVGLVNHQLAMSDIDCTFSGSTLVSVLIQGTNIYSANAGDSRATIGRVVNTKQNNKVQKSLDYQYQVDTQTQHTYEAKPLTRDHKPGLADESERILKQGGRIDSFRDKQGNRLGPLRVWVRNENYPGLAMSRSIGDDAATSVGVTWEPEIFHFNLEFEDKFMIVASDGVWEFIDDDQIVEMIAPFYENGDIEGACDYVMEESYARWTIEDDSVIDDTSLIIIFFHQKADDTSCLSPSREQE